ncbi:hypothetical protein EI94DRAFT_1754829 [Lactarius quietus]|nr:hypothetical protein EI94DRAFT_1754829 [Lactarius quietus]
MHMLSIFAVVLQPHSVRVLSLRLGTTVALVARCGSGDHTALPVRAHQQPPDSFPPGINHSRSCSRLVFLSSSSWTRRDLSGVHAETDSPIGNGVTKPSD